MKQKIYLIVDKKNEDLAHELLQGNAYHVTNMRNLVLRSSNSNILIIALIDESPSPFLMKELRIAEDLCSVNKQVAMIPVVINNAPVPSCLQNRLCITLDKFSHEDKKRVRYEIAKFVERCSVVTHELEEKRKRDMSRELTIITMIVAVFATIFSLIITTMKEYLFMQEEFVFIISILIVVTMTMFVFTYISIQNKRRRIENELESKSYSRRLIDAISFDTNLDERNDKDNKDVKAEIDAIGRMLINLEDIKEFYTWSQKQAKAAFVLAIVMCCLGFALIATAIIISLTSKEPNNISIITGLGGVIVEVVAGTALIVYRSSLSQLNHYHQALHEDERFLSSTNLLDRFTDDSARDEMLKEIIRSEIQMNLNTLQEGMYKKERIILQE